MFKVLRVKKKIKRNGRNGQGSKTPNSKFRKGKYKIKSFLVFLPRHKAKALEPEPEPETGPGPRPDPELEPELRQDKMGKDLSDDQVSSMKEAFTLFDTDGDGKIAPSELGILMRYLGGNPTQAQLKAIVAEEKLTAPLDFPRFLDLMGKHMKAEPFQRQLRDAFKVLDKESTGFVLVADLRNLLTTIGEKLEPSEFDAWIGEVEVGSDGKLCYEEFISRMVEY